MKHVCDFCLILLGFLILPLISCAQLSEQEIFVNKLQVVVGNKAQVSGGIFSANSQLENTILYSQLGNYNRLDNSTIGKGNNLIFSQSGDGNVIKLNLVGDDNQYLFTQSGGTNKINFENTVTTSNTQLTIIQQGGGNTLKARENISSSGMHIKIMQSGGATAIINSPLYAFPTTP